MRAYVFCSSRTGNPSLLADVIRQHYQNELAASADEADVVFVGAWIDRSEMASEAATLTRSLRNKQVFFFGTCDSCSEEDDARVFRQACAMLDDSNHVVGHFYCLGQMPLDTRAQCVALLRENPDDQALQAKLKHYDESCNHPNLEDADRLKAMLSTLEL